uniref:alpha-(1,3)-fucosyltransferase 11-like isoform X1 n=3 Tax=Styela clava TaxID=7725 RepID=UPI001939ED81|nr:alpha-(1,3)-fucosyltransferase 11-like isoform X1 [Styela clava]
MQNFIYKILVMLTTAVAMNSFQRSDVNINEWPLIVWWYDTIFPHVDNGGSVQEIDCGEVKCHSTHHRDMIEQDTLQTILFYGSDFEPTDLPLPKKNNHMWALLHEESPQNNFILCHKDVLKLFNFSSTFKQHSDYPLTTQHIQSIEYILDREPISILEKNELRQNGLAPVLYLQSHCDVPSDRDRYVSELMKHIQVDSYGECLNNIEFDDDDLVGIQSMNSEELYELIGQYKFHITFENALCDDYITEKIYRALHVGSVPIYMGASNVQDWVPNGSYISVKDFRSPKALAVLLNSLDMDDDSYLNYLEFKKSEKSIPENLKAAIKNRDWSTSDSGSQHFLNGFECYVCKEMHKMRDTLKDGGILTSRVLDESHLNCTLPQPSVGTVKTLKKDDTFHETLNYYQQTAIHAKVLVDLIRKGKNDLSDFWELVAEFMEMASHTEL